MPCDGFRQGAGPKNKLAHLRNTGMRLYGGSLDPAGFHREAVMAHGIAEPEVWQCLLEEESPFHWQCPHDDWLPACQTAEISLQHSAGVLRFCKPCDEALLEFHGPHESQNPVSIVMLFDNTSLPEMSILDTRQINNFSWVGMYILDIIQVVRSWTRAKPLSYLAVSFEGSAPWVHRW